MMRLNVQGLHIETLQGRPLVRDLSLQLEQDKVAIIGRNGVGKSTLLRTLVGERPPSKGAVVRNGTVAWVPQLLTPVPGLSPGQLRCRLLMEAFAARPDLLLLDEPTEDLDGPARTWLLGQIRRFDGALLVVSHDRELLREFGHFFQMAESGCRYLPGNFADVQQQLIEEDRTHQLRYARTLSRLANHEAKHRRVQQRRARKKAVGRVHELDRNQSRMRLNKRRSGAQVSQAKVRAQSARGATARRTWAQASRRALKVELGLALTVARVPPASGPVIAVDAVGLRFGEHTVFERVNLEVERHRLAVVGPNGSGKSCLLRLMVHELAPSTGHVRSRLERIGFIAQGATNWAPQESVLERLARTSSNRGIDAVAERLVAHRFPLALAMRPLASLSPGERTRAALICLFQQPDLEVLVLDEPTFSLDMVGNDALTRALKAWRGGLVVASHDRVFLGDIGIEDRLALPRPSATAT